jgi:hypothetical protein
MDHYDGTKAAYIGLIGVVTVAIIGLTGALSVPIITELTKLLFAPTATFTPTPTKTPVTASPTITDTPTLPPVPSPTPTPTPYYVEIVVDASERMGVEFEGGITKMETAWQTAGTIARTRALKGQFVSIRTFGSGSEQPDMGCFESDSVFSFTNQDSEIKACLTTRPIPCGQAAVVTALTDASANLMAHENIGREIILLTGGEDGCGSDLSVFYSSDNQALWTQTFVILFADEDFGPFINLRAQGANINYNLVRNRAEAETVAEEVAHSLPPTPTPMPTPTPPPPLPTPATGDTPQPTSTPKPPPPTPTGGTAAATRPLTPIVSQSPTPTGTSTDTPTSTQTAVPPTNTPTTTPTNTPTTTPTATPSATLTATPPSFQWTPLPPQNDVFAQNCPLIGQTTGFYKFQSGQATISANLVSGGHTGQGLRLNFTAVITDYHYSGWEVVLGDISSGIDLTQYNSLTFYIRGAVGGEMPNVWLMTPIAGGGYRQYYRDVET